MLCENIVNSIKLNDHIHDDSDRAVRAGTMNNQREIVSLQ